MKRNLHKNAAGLLLRADKGSALWLVDELNKQDKGFRQLGQLVNDLQDILCLARQKEHRDRDGRLTGSRAVTLFHTINSRLRRVKWSPYLFSGPKKGLTLDWGSRNSRLGDTTDFGAGTIFNLATAGLHANPDGDWRTLILLMKVRRCSHCKKWFLAKKRDHVNCFVNCRVARYRHTPEGREKNRNYMRWYREQTE